MATYGTDAPKQGSRAAIGAATGGVLDPAAGLPGLVQGASTGAGVGMAGGPIGAAAGALIGGAIGFFAGAADAQAKKVDDIMASQKAEKEEYDAKRNAAIDAAADVRASSTLPGSTSAETIATPSVSSTAMKYMKKAPTPYDAWNSAIYGG